MRSCLCAVIAVFLYTGTLRAQPPAIIKRNQPEKGHFIKPVTVKTAVWSDKGYAITLLPPALKNTYLVVRPAGAALDWLDRREYTVAADCTVYLAVRNEFNGRKDFTNDQARKLTDAGWEEVDELFRVGAPKDENWKWRIFKKDIPKGKVDIEVEGVKLTGTTLFLFGKRAAK